MKRLLSCRLHGLGLFVFSVLAIAAIPIIAPISTSSSPFSQSSLHFGALLGGWVITTAEWAHALNATCTFGKLTEPSPDKNANGSDAAVANNRSEQ